MQSIRSGRRVFRISCCLVAAALAGAGGALFGVCGPFTDVSDAGFCPFVLEIFALGITTGTTPTTYDPSGNVSRIQMAAFLSRTVDRVLRRGSRRAALNQFWTAQAPINLGTTSLTSPILVQSDGLDVWVTNGASESVFRVRASDGALLQTWTGATQAWGVLSAMGRVFVAGSIAPGALYRINPSQPPGAVTTVASNLGNSATGIAFDGGRIWTANLSGSVSIVTPTLSLPWTVTTVTGFGSLMRGILYDGANVWVADLSAGTLLKLDANAAVLQTVTVGSNPAYPAFDGTNIWVPNSADLTGAPSLSVVRASTGAVLATLTGNGLTEPWGSAFDGERVLVTNLTGGVSLFKAADLTPLGSFQTGAGSNPFGACSDGINFWIALQSPGQLARF